MYYLLFILYYKIKYPLNNIKIVIKNKYFNRIWLKKRRKKNIYFKILIL